MTTSNIYITNVQKDSTLSKLSEDLPKYITESLSGSTRFSTQYTVFGEAFAYQKYTRQYFTKDSCKPMRTFHLVHLL